ncbi:hypothetical protein [Rhodococcus sp. NPDC058514]|uniref:CdiA C-terminal domain-containing protein n=1 Tax=unclassified Rhodococcus (in: high G+C Gram-positive bacteria) TaxID=192944 RepID=UPI00364D1021
MPGGIKQHELETAERAAALGHAVAFVPATGRGRTPDVKIDGVRWELKSPSGSGKSTITDILRSACGQGERVVLDLARTPLPIAEVNAQISAFFERYTFVYEVWVFPRKDEPYRRSR